MFVSFAAVTSKNTEVTKLACISTTRGALPYSKGMVDRVMLEGLDPIWAWMGVGTLNDYGRVCYKSVKKNTPGVGLEIYTVGDVVTIDRHNEEGLWIAQVTEFTQEGEGTDGMYMKLRWFY